MIPNCLRCNGEVDLDQKDATVTVASGDKVQTTVDLWHCAFCGYQFYTPEQEKEAVRRAEARTAQQADTTDTEAPG